MPPKRSSSRRSSRGRDSDNDMEKVEISRRSRRSALIQITFGRAAHSLSAMAAILLAIAAIIIFLLTNWDALADNAPSWLEDVKWLMPLAVGIAMSSIVIYLKWDPFITDRMERPFIVSYISLAVPLATAVVIVLHSIGQLNVGAGRWVYPTSFIGISLSLVSIAMIWEGMSRRKIVAIVSALIPLVIMSVPALFRSDTILDILPIVYLGSALCIQLSGSMMHLMSTTTSVHERELLKASDAKIVTMREELEMRKEEVEFREKGLGDREIELETYEKRLHDIKLDLDERERRVDRVEAALEGREEKILEDKKMVKSSEFDIGSREELLDHRKAELDAKEKDQQALITNLNEKMGLLDEIKSQLQDEKAELSRWAKELEESEVLLNEELERLRSGREVLLAENKMLAEKRKELELKESSLEMKLMSAESSRAASSDSDRVKTLSDWEERILVKERQIAEEEMEISKRRIEAEEITKQAERREARSDEKLATLEEKEKGLKDQESLVRDLQGEISREKAKLQQEKAEIEASRDDLASVRDRYELLIKKTGERADKFTSNEEIVERKMSALDAREEKVKSLHERLKRETEEIEKRRRELIDLDKKMSAKNADLQMRELEIRERSRRLEETLAKGAVEGTETSALLDDIKQREKALRMREKKLEEREKDLKKKQYEAKKSAEEEAEVEEELEPSEVERAEKISTGTKRLDDLLYGGLPYGSSVLFVGPPFSGKEIAILSFISEGLKAGVPAIIVTTSRSPGDLLKDFAPILPTFLDIERLGLVKWIDATGGKDAKGPSVQIRKNLIKVEGPDDLPGILEAIEKFSEDVRRGDYPYFKLGYMSLSTSIAHSGEIEAGKFIQAIARVVRERSSAGLFALEKGMHNEQQIESIQHLMDGALNVKLEKQKTFLSVIGIGDVQTRDWVEFRHTNKGLIIGAFSLERIR